jgi:hypothetical protein
MSSTATPLKTTTLKTSACADPCSGGSGATKHEGSSSASSERGAALGQGGLSPTICCFKCGDHFKPYYQPEKRSHGDAPAFCISCRLKGEANRQRCRHHGTDESFECGCTEVRYSPTLAAENGGCLAMGHMEKQRRKDWPENLNPCVACAGMDNRPTNRIKDKRSYLKIRNNVGAMAEGVPGYAESHHAESFSEDTFTQEEIRDLLVQEGWHIRKDGTVGRPPGRPPTGIRDEDTIWVGLDRGFLYLAVYYPELFEQLKPNGSLGIRDLVGVVQALDQSLNVTATGEAIGRSRATVNRMKQAGQEHLRQNPLRGETMTRPWIRSSPRCSLNQVRRPKWRQQS